jgi:hypothetical protein
VVKKVLELVLITFVRRMAYGKCLRCIQWTSHMDQH